jgi:hypothetical protein
MAEIMVRFDDLRRYCEKLHVGSVPLEYIKQMPTIEAEPVRHGRWIECDYKHMEHGMIETEPKAGLCCSECRTGFKKNRMTYKAFCPACGARMDGGADNG